MGSTAPRKRIVSTAHRERWTLRTHEEHLDWPAVDQYGNALVATTGDDLLVQCEEVQLRAADLRVREHPPREFFAALAGQEGADVVQELRLAAPRQRRPRRVGRLPAAQVCSALQMSEPAPVLACCAKVRSSA